MGVKRSKKGVKKVKQQYFSFQEISGDKRGQNAHLVRGAQRQRCLTRACSGAFGFVFFVFFSPYFVERICPVYARRTSLPQIALPSVNFNFKDKDKSIYLSALNVFTVSRMLFSF